MMKREHSIRYGRGSIVGGLVLMTIGIVFLLENFNLLRPDVFSRWWPLLLILIGVLKLWRWADSKALGRANSNSVSRQG